MPFELVLELLGNGLKTAAQFLLTSEIETDLAGKIKELIFGCTFL